MTATDALVSVTAFLILLLGSAAVVEGGCWLRDRRRRNLHADDWGAEGWSVHRW